MPVAIKVNGREHLVEAAPDTPLLYVLRDDLGLNGAKYGCGLGQCGACTVLIDGAASRSCILPLGEVGPASITTLEGLTGKDGGLHPLQKAFLAEQAGQCAYCASGMIMTAAAFLAETPRPSEADIRSSLDGNLCRCGSHNRIVRAVERAAAEMAS